MKRYYNGLLTASENRWGNQRGGRQHLLIGPPIAPRARHTVPMGVQLDEKLARQEQAEQQAGAMVMLPPQAMGGI